jgi:hypothetical protein
MRLVLVLLLSALCAGCFVFDEIDAGMEIMEAHTPADKKKPAAAAKAEADGEKPPTYNESVQGWFENAKTLAPRKEGGDNPMVQCKLGGSTRFTKRTDCRTQGGEEV